MNEYQLAAGSEESFNPQKAYISLPRGLTLRLLFNLQFPHQHLDIVCRHTEQGRCNSQGIIPIRLHKTQKHPQIKVTHNRRMHHIRAAVLTHIAEITRTLGKYVVSILKLL